MDIERIKKISDSKIQAGVMTTQVRDAIKEYQHEKRDVQNDLSETFQPIIKAQENTKQTIDEKQEKMLEQLQKNQKALTTGNLPENLQLQEPTKLPIDYKPDMMEKKYKSDMDKGFNATEIQKLTEYKLPPPSTVLKSVAEGVIDFDKFNSDIGKLLNNIGGKKGNLSKGKSKTKNKTQIDRLTEDIKLIQKYRERIETVKEGVNTLISGTGYTQPKRNAYKISSSGQYGGLMIDIPKLMGQLHLVAKKDNRKVLDKKVDFDTIDLLTKRFNSKKKYSPLSKMVFFELNNLSDIPIHKTSMKYKKIGSGVTYYNNINDLIDRMELLGGSILAGSNGARDEFSQIAHTLNKLGSINNNQLIELLKEYLI